jgi:phage shock protein A
VRRAHEQLARRAVAERVAMADRVVDVEEQLEIAAAATREMETHVAWLAERLAATQEAVAWHSERQAAAEAELRGMRETKIFRWTSPARDLWAWWRTRRP